MNLRPIPSLGSSLTRTMKRPPLPLLGVILAMTLPCPLQADDLDSLLTPAGGETKLVDDAATEAWNGVVDAFRRNDLDSARSMGREFLEANHRTSPYQVLGVRVMMDLADADSPRVTRDVALSGEAKRLAEERESIRVEYARLRGIANAADARINKLTLNRKQAVQMGTAAYAECVRAARDLEQAQAAMEAMKPKIAANKEKMDGVEVSSHEKLRQDTLKLLDMLIEAGEIEAAFAITNVFVRAVGADLEVAKKQQDVIRLREDHAMASKLAQAITGEIEPMLAAGKGSEARVKFQTMVSKVEASDQSASVKKLTKSKLEALRVKIGAVGSHEAIARQAGMEEKAEIGDRLDVLEAKLERAQELLGTTIRSVDGFASFSGDCRVESDGQKDVAKLRETLRSGQISKEKIDNLVKAKSDHAGILREVETLQSSASSLTTVQRGRLANLQETTRSALELLGQVER